MQNMRRGYWGLEPLKNEAVLAPLLGLQIGDLQRGEGRILGVGDASLAAEIKAKHGHAVAGIGVGRDGQAAHLGR